ncbi:MAG: hypothetical protein ACRC6U_07405, partial [Fusobacteriaceae bacterium]
MKKSNTATYQTIGFSGSRSVLPPSSQIYALKTKFPTQKIIVGDCRGTDALIQKTFKNNNLQIVKRKFEGKGSFVERSLRFLKILTYEENAALFAYPGREVRNRKGSKPLKPTPKPKEAFSGHGSGTWATVALAIGWGIPTYVFLDYKLDPPFFLEQIENTNFYQTKA